MASILNDVGIGGTLTSSRPSSTCTTVPMLGLALSSSWTHQHATLHALSTSAMSASPRTRPSTAPVRSPPPASRLAAAAGKKSTVPSGRCLLNTSALAVTAVPATHSGARYPAVPRTVGSTRLASRPMSLASPKSATLGASAPSRRMFSGLMSQWMIRSLHFPCR
ncbi:hypothetical protein PVAP13_1KG139005 [Panicum virgatum]|uniref:Uncharacterized protein n=1 Tax=Panicum virgatum TaxID=38727 RepID=A0A8T0XEU2_PANVG|nr:hypothetical protein PVAP13_1KG139005 [Panicum virgatum]